MGEGRERAGAAAADSRSRRRAPAPAARRFLIASGTSLLVCLCCSCAAILACCRCRPRCAARRASSRSSSCSMSCSASGRTCKFADPSLTADSLRGDRVPRVPHVLHGAGARRADPVLPGGAAVRGAAAGHAAVAVPGRVRPSSRHVTMLGLWHADAGATRVRSATRSRSLLIVLPWFAAMGGYVNRLRHRLRQEQHGLCARRCASSSSRHDGADRRL